MHVPTAEKVLYITINTHRFEHMMKEIEPDKIQTQLRQSTALIGIVNISWAAIGMNAAAAINMLKKSAISTYGEVWYESI